MWRHETVRPTDRPTDRRAAVIHQLLLGAVTDAPAGDASPIKHVDHRRSISSAACDTLYAERSSRRSRSTASVCIARFTLHPAARCFGSVASPFACDNSALISVFLFTYSQNRDDLLTGTVTVIQKQTCGCHCPAT